jgi:HNH endonuclease
MANCSVENCNKTLRSSGAKYCAAHYHRLYRYGTLELIGSSKKNSKQPRKPTSQGMPLPICHAEGCNRTVISRNNPHCELHYWRMKRWNTTDDINPPKERYKTADGYILIRRPDHPLCRESMNGRVFEHRIVYYENHGEGPFHCHWCGIPITWHTLHIDHVDDNRQNNSPVNLVASCQVCNHKRGLKKMATHPRARRFIEHEGKTMCLADWAREKGMHIDKLRGRLNRGWLPARALAI